MIRSDEAGSACCGQEPNMSPQQNRSAERENHVGHNKGAAMAYGLAQRTVTKIVSRTAVQGIFTVLIMGKGIGLFYH